MSIWNFSQETLRTSPSAKIPLHAEMTRRGNLRSHHQFIFSISLCHHHFIHFHLHLHLHLHLLHHLYNDDHVIIHHDQQINIINHQPALQEWLTMILTHHHHQHHHHHHHHPNHEHQGHVTEKDWVVTVTLVYNVTDTVTMTTFNIWQCSNNNYSMLCLCRWFSLSTIYNYNKQLSICLPTWPTCLQSESTYLDLPMQLQAARS